jgi:hypothetical protein
VTAEATGSYPHDLAGPDAAPPVTPPAHVLEMARRAATRAAPALEDDGPLYAAGEWRMAAALVVLADEANHANPERDRRSDGTIGDAAHRKLGRASDHNPWLTHRGVGVCRARDLDASGLDLAAAFERARVAAYKDPKHPLRGGGYLIYAGRITRPDFTAWAEYTGSNPHVTHGHVSVSTDPARFDARTGWGIFVTPPKPAHKPAPAKTPERPERVNVRWLERGSGHYPPGDPRHAATRRLQNRLRTRFPLYARRLVVDGYYGPATEAAVTEFQRRKHIEVSGIAGPVTLRLLGL